MCNIMTPNLFQQNKFSEFGQGCGQAGVDDSVDVPSESFQNERNKYAKKGIQQCR